MTIDLLDDLDAVDAPPRRCPEHGTPLDRTGRCFACDYDFDPSEDPGQQ